MTPSRQPSTTSSTHAYYLSATDQTNANRSVSSLASSPPHGPAGRQERKPSSSSHRSTPTQSKSAHTQADSSPSSPPVSSRQEPVKKKQSWKDLRKKPSLSNSREPATPTYIHHPPVSHLSPAPPMPTKYASIPARSGPPLASLYLVAGLPKQTHTWTLADASSIQGVHHRPGAVGGWWRSEVLGSNTAPVPSASGSGEEGDEWAQKLSGKALKYSFTREIEIISSTLQPASTVHTFQFDLATPATGSKGLHVQADLHHRSSTSSTQPGFTTYHGVTLTVYSHADATKTAAIRKALEAAASLPPQTSTSSKFGSSGFAPSKSGAFSGFGAASDSRPRTGSVVGGGEYWLPYALTLVSKFPIYSIMSDYLKISWAKFSKDVTNHSRMMTKIIQAPSPRAGELIRLRIASPSAHDEDGDHDPDALEIVAPFPGSLDMNTGLIGIGWEQWPLFKVLSLDNVLTVVETALSPNGRVMFHSRHPALLGIAVMTLRYICELRGWEGMAHPIVHARDVQLLLEDGGPWIIGLDSEAKYISKPGPDVCVVDLDINFVNLSAPAPGVLSTGQTRDKLKSRLVKAFGDGNGYFTEHSVPAEFMEAYPGGRLRPLCQTVNSSGEPDALSSERIGAPNWWDQAKVMVAFDQLLAYKTKRPGFFKRLGGADKDKSRDLSLGEKVARTNMRRRANQFVDARDEMEGKLGRLSRRLAFLVHETDVWKERFTEFEALTEKLGSEASELKTRIEKEKRESRRLSTVVSEKEKEKENLRSKLQETEQARYAALGKMAEMEQTMKTIERERDEMMASIENQLESALGNRNPSERADSRASSAQAVSRSSSRRAESRSSSSASGEPSDALRKLNGGSDALNSVQEETASIMSANPKKKRFSAMAGRNGSGKADPFDEIDDRITASSLSVQDKVAAIQRKLDLALESITAHNVRQSMDGHRSSLEVDSADPNVDDGTRPASPETPVQVGTGGQIFSAISSIFSSHPSADATPRQSVAVEASDELETSMQAPPPPSAFRSPVKPAINRTLTEATADLTEHEDFISADEGHRSSSPVSSDEDQDDGFDSDDEPTLHDGQQRPPPRAPRTQHARPPSSSAFGTPQSIKTAIFGSQHERTGSEISSSTSGELDGEEADRSLTGSTSSDSVRTAVRKKSIGAGADEDDLIVPSLSKVPTRSIERAAVHVE